MGALYLTIKLDYLRKTTEDGKVLKDSGWFQTFQSENTHFPFGGREMPVGLEHQLALVQ